MAPSTGRYDLRPVRPADYLAFVAERGSASFLQTPAWAAVKTDWRSELLGWYDGGGQLRGGCLVLHRPLPVLSRSFLARSLAYVPEGPLLPWDEVARSPDEWLAPLERHVRSRGAFTLKIGPPIVTRRWSAETVKAAIAAGHPARVGELAADVTDATAADALEGLRSRGYTRKDAGGAGFGDVQPRYVFQVPLAGRSTDDLWSGLNQLWRRNVRRAEKSGVEVTVGGYADLPEFHDLYVVTARRDGFTPRPLSYFQRMMSALSAEDPQRFRLYLARHDGDLIAATIMVTVGEHVWYSYGASADVKRDLRPSNAIQWRMLCDAQAAGATVYDLRGISDTLVESDPLFGLLRFKLGTGGEVVEYAGEWDLVLRPWLARAVDLYLQRRARH
jgi:lipid II:glycine glycyltransferase (peptidoglycan interpeptide bridge formation enzyme)